MEFASTPMGVVLFLIGSGFLFWEKKRKFDRTNRAGVEQFGSFGKKVSAKAFDWILSWLSIFFIPAGVIILAFQYQDTWGWIVTLPVSAIALLLVL